MMGTRRARFGLWRRRWNQQVNEHHLLPSHNGYGAGLPAPISLLLTAFYGEGQWAGDQGWCSKGVKSCSSVRAPNTMQVSAEEQSVGIGLRRSSSPHVPELHSPDRGGASDGNPWQSHF